MSVSAIRVQVSAIRVPVPAIRVSVGVSDVSDSEVSSTGSKLITLHRSSMVD